MINIDCSKPFSCLREAKPLNRTPKNSILVISYYYDLMNTNTICIEPLLDRLIEEGYGIRVICCTQKPEVQKSMDKIRGITVYPVRSVLQQKMDWIESKLRLDSDKNIDILRRAMRFLVRRVVPDKHRENFFLSAGPNVAEEVINNHSIAAVLSISNPICNHQLAKKIKERNAEINWTLYQLDPYAYNLSLNNGEQQDRFDTEDTLWSAADRIVITEEMQRLDNSLKVVNKFSENTWKTLAVPLPNFVLGARTIESLPESMDSSKINLVFTGNVYGDFRKPEALLDILSRLNNELFVFHVYGWGMESYLKQYPKLIRQIVIHGRVPKEDLATALDSATILINFGNKMANQTPSKVFDYIATGKPIINFAYEGSDTSLHYLNRYPLFLNIYNHEADSDESAKKFVEFCEYSKGRSVSREKIVSLYRDLLSEKVCSQIISHMLT